MNYIKKYCIFKMKFKFITIEFYKKKKKGQQYLIILI